MSEPLDSSRHPTRERLLASPSLRGLPAGAEALPAEVVLGDLPWDGPVVDPERLDARTLLARLR